MFWSLDLRAPRASAPPESGLPDVDAAWEAALAAALTPALASAKPSEAFVAHLGHQLVATAQSEAQEHKVREQRLAIAGVVGGIVSLVGGLVFWLLWRQHHKPHAAATAAAPAKTGWTWGWKSLSRAHPTH
jgi:hypothetical protein